MNKKTLRMVTVVVAMLIVAAPVLWAEGGHRGGKRVRIVQPKADSELLYSILVADWWQWYFSFPYWGDSPFNPEVCCVVEGQPSNVMYLAGAPAVEPDVPGEPREPVIRDCTVPAETYVFFPLINTECSNLEPDPFFGDDEASCLACNDKFYADVDDLMLIIDDKEIRNLHKFRVQSEIFPIGPFPEDNDLGLIPDVEGISLADGYYILLAPLGEGEHTILLMGCLEAFGGCEGFEIRVLYTLTVVGDGD